jgi:ribonucleoside-diphosphate reductase alpha chain
VKYKKLVGGGTMKIVNQSVRLALENLNYDPRQCDDIVKYVEKHGYVERAPHLLRKDYPVFDCAFVTPGSERCIAVSGHLAMMAAAQPHLSGAISKTVNMPNDSTVKDIYDTYVKAWMLNLKSVALYRDGCKRSQPLNTSLEKNNKLTDEVAEVQVDARAIRRKLSRERQAITHKFSIAGHDGYITAGMYDDKTLGEIFLLMSKEGSVVSGLMDSFATAVSLALQYGVPLEVLVDKFVHTRFEPSGFTNNPDIPIAKSLVDYIFRWLSIKFLHQEPHVSEPLEVEKNEEVFVSGQTDAPPCSACGHLTVRKGACYTCPNCGQSGGCG